MLSLFDLGCFFADMTAIVFELCRRIKCFLTFIALITPSIRIVAIGTNSNNETISKPKIAISAIALCHGLFQDFIMVIDVHKNFLSDVGMPFSAGSSKVVKPNIKPFIHLGVNFKVKIADFFW
jgi:hypothetical protein